MSQKSFLNENKQMKGDRLTLKPNQKRDK